MNKPTWIWMNGELVPHDEANFHVGTPALHFGPAVFEGLRCYGLPGRPSNFFRLGAHLERLHASAAAFHFEIPFSSERLEAACIELVRANDHRDAYVRPIAFVGGSALGFGLPGRTQTCILSYPWDNRHLEGAQRTGVRAHVSKVIRTEAKPNMSKAKVSANYAAGLLAIHEARSAGFEEALLLDRTGAVAEAATSNVFAVWGDRLVTPPGDLPILLGVTRDALLTLAKDLGLDVAEKAFGLDELRAATEVFLCGTTSEITPVREIDGRVVGDGRPGKITQTLLRALHGAIRGEDHHPSSTNQCERGWSHWVDWS